jgi:hypothetical protein
LLYYQPAFQEKDRVVLQEVGYIVGNDFGGCCCLFSRGAAYNEEEQFFFFYKLLIAGNPDSQGQTARLKPPSDKLVISK